MTKPTGLPRGRPRKRPAPITTPLEIANKKLIEAGEAGVLFDLTESEIRALTPRDVFRLMLHHAVRSGDLRLARDAARDWAPYEHARPTEGHLLTAGDLRRIGDLARAEIVRRGLKIDNFD